MRTRSEGSRGAAAECSPTRERGVGIRLDLSPGGATDFLRICRPSGADFDRLHYPRASPVATLCRRSAAFNGKGK